MDTSRIIILIVVLAALAVLVFFLYRFAQKNRKKKDEQEASIKQMSQHYTLLVIDKKRMRLKKAGLPQEVIDETPWYARRSKVPVVKVKVGQQILTMVADGEIFDIIPVKKEVKATVAGIYITDVRGIRSRLEKPVKRGNFLSRFMGGFMGR